MLQDELLFEVPPDEMEKYKAVPITAEGSAGCAESTGKSNHKKGWLDPQLLSRLDNKTQQSILTSVASGDLGMDEALDFVMDFLKNDEQGT